MRNESFEGKLVPSMADLEGFLTENPDAKQSDCCDIAMCGEDDFDCGECIFSHLWCNKATFEHWKTAKLEDYGNGQ